MKPLSGVMIILIIGGGVLIFLILFLFAKRQIMRFALRSRRGPHVPVGNDTKKQMRREIERRLDCIQRITYEPKLIWDDNIYILKPDLPLPSYYYRMQAMDDVKILEKEIIKNDGSVRHPNDSLRAFLLTTLAPPLNGSGVRMIHQFMDMYEHARHDPNEFGSVEYDSYHRLLMKLIDAAKVLKSFSNSRKTSPSRTPVKKQTKMQSLLDPSRLKPPPLSTGFGFSNESEIQNEEIVNIPVQKTKAKLTLGLQQHQLPSTIVQQKIVEKEKLSLELKDKDIIHHIPNVEGIPDDENEIISISKYSDDSRN